MQDRLNALEHRITYLQKDTEHRLKNLENKSVELDKESKQTSNILVKLDTMLDTLIQSIERMEKSNVMNFELVHSRITSVKRDVKQDKQQELQSYVSYKKAVMVVILTSITSALMGAVLAAVGKNG